VAHIYSTREVAEFLGFPPCETWRIRRLFEDGTFPEPGRFAGKRAIPSELVPQIVDECRRRGWLPVEVEAATR
jgi:hypothetical protein